MVIFVEEREGAGNGKQRRLWCWGKNRAKHKDDYDCDLSLCTIFLKSSQPQTSKIFKDDVIPKNKTTNISTIKNN